MIATKEQQESAYNQVVSGVYHPVFFERLKQAGIVPSNEMEAKQLLYLGGQLYAKHQQVEAAQVEKQSSLLELAINELDQAQPSDSPRALDLFAKQAAADLLQQDPNLLTYGSVIVDMYAAE